MPAAWIGAGAAVIGAASQYNASKKAGKSVTGSTSGPQYQYGYNIGGVDTDWNKLQGQSMQQAQQSANIGNALNLQAVQQGQAVNYNPYLQASAAAGQQTGQLANTLQGYGQLMGQQGINAQQQQIAMQEAGRGVYNTALDPQSALYDRTRQQMQEQAAATNSMYGLGSSGAGAGIQNQAMSNFNIDWQNQQLQRQLAGLQGYTGAQQTALGYGAQMGQDLTAAAGFQGMVPGLTQQAAQIPLSAQQYVAAAPQQLANQYLQTANLAQSPLNTQMSQQLAYMTGGSSSQAGAAQIAQQQQQFNAQQQQQAMSGFTQGIGQLAELWKNTDWGGSGGGGGGTPLNWNSPDYTGNNYGWTYQP